MNYSHSIWLFARRLDGQRKFLWVIGYCTCIVPAMLCTLAVKAVGDEPTTVVVFYSSGAKIQEYRPKTIPHQPCLWQIPSILGRLKFVFKHSGNPHVN